MTSTNAFRVRRDLEIHPWIVASKLDPGLERIVIVNVSSWRASKDQACIIEPGEHPCIPHRSVIVYGKACIGSRAKLNEGIEAGIIDPQEPVGENLMARILAGFVVSEQTPIEVLEFLEAQGLIESR